MTDVQKAGAVIVLVFAFTLYVLAALLVRFVRVGL
ncbi:hypothetical protein LCGC14_2519700 [marine sediment metagenome]|uniref:Uncharacterized protein n=1 Tax=marine sediment metagenome TaxID=412755 RepID=A0A0F9BJR0_9ZZZZ